MYNNEKTYEIENVNQNMGFKLDNRQSRRMLEKMGLNLEEMPEVSEVVIKTKEKDIIIKSPQVSKLKSKGIDMYQIMGNDIEEVILATSATVEGQTTAFYIQDSLKKTNIKISKLAQGLPVGGEIESLDDGTLISAFKNRQSLIET